MMSLGTLLVKHGWISKQQLGLAISKQRQIGGRLGTCLLEMGAIAEDLLNRSLAEQQGVPCAAAEELQDIPEKVTRLLPAPIAIRYRAIPFRSTHNDVDMAMLDVDNLWLQDELSFIVGRRLNVYIASEARIVEALSRYYRAPCSERFAKLLDRLGKARLDAVTGHPHPQSRLMRSDGEQARERQEARRPAVPAPIVATNLDSRRFSVPPDLRQQPASRRSIRLSAGQRANLEAEPARKREVPDSPAYVPYVRDAGARSPLSIEEAAVALETGVDPQEIGHTLLSVLSQEFTRAGVLQASASSVRGWLADGPGLDRDRYSQYRVSFDQPSIFLNLREGGSFFLGTLPEMPAHLGLVACWHKDLSDECAVFPIRVRDRMVALIYGDCGPLGLADLDLDLVRTLCVHTSRGFERCIVEKKRQKRSAAQGK